MELMILLAIGTPLLAVIWLITRAINDRDQIEELTRRIDNLDQELRRIQSSAGAEAKAKTTEESLTEKVAGFMPASPPARKVAETILPAPASAAVIPPVAARVPPLLPPRPSAPLAPNEPNLPAWPVGPRADTPVARSTPELESPAIPPPPIIPPLSESGRLSAESASEPAEAEPVLPTARVAAAPEAGVPEIALEKTSFEMRFGKYWAVRIGVVIVLTGCAFLAKLAYHNFIPKLGAAERISLLYLASGLLLGAGAWWQRRSVRESLKNYGQVLFAGGLAAVYFTTFAAHYAPPVCVIASPLIDGALLFIWAGVIAWIADRRKSEVMAVFAVGLAFFTSVITRVGEFTLYSNLLLTIAAVVFLVRNRWAGLSFAGLITSYVGYGCWRFLHETDWHWAPPVEHFFLGVAFLACYWVVFTAAAFLSRSERLSGSSRAAFLTLNNGAYFVLFLLSMLQVQLGGFWKFSLGYGTVLLALAALAIKVLPSEPLTRSAYLTQGLVLVTLGFIAKFSGLNLALVLGAESVVLFMLGVQRQSRVLKFFGHAAAWLATGWCGFALTPFETQAGYMAVGLGLLLAANAGGALWSESRPGRISNRLESTLFTLLAFAGWAMAAWSNTTDPHLSVALVLALASVVFYNVIGGQKFVVPKVAAYLGAASAVIWGLVTLRRFDQAGLWFGIAVGGFLLLNAWRAQRECADNPQPLRLEPTAFAVLALAGWLAATWSNTTQANLPLVLAAEAVAFTFSIYLLRLREVTLLGQSFLLLAQAAWVFDSVNATPPWWRPFAIIAVTLGLSYWWQHPKWIPRRPETDPCMRGPWRQIALLYRWLALGMSLLWIWDYVPERQRIWACTLAAACLFALALGRQLREALAAAAVYAVAALALLWLRDGLVMDIYWPNLLSMLALLAMQQWLRRRPAQLPLDDRVHAAAVLLVGSSLWRFLSCWTALSLMGYSVTLIWAVYAVLVFAAGIVLHERYFRWFGLAVLAAAIGRVAFVDFWNEGTVSRVLTILALGIAFLVVGFLYNKFQEKIRRWL